MGASAEHQTDGARVTKVGQCYLQRVTSCMLVCTLHAKGSLAPWHTLAANTEEGWQISLFASSWIFALVLLQGWPAGRISAAPHVTADIQRLPRYHHPAAAGHIMSIVMVPATQLTARVA